MGLMGVRWGEEEAEGLTMVMGLRWLGNFV